MNISVILAHPHPGSFNHAIADEAAAILQKSGHTVTVHDLYREQFDPLLLYDEIPRDAPLDPVIALHCREIATADGIVFVHPNWWGMPPAILKGWIDRVLRPGIAYRFAETDTGEGIPEGLLVAGAVLVFNTVQHTCGTGAGGLRRPARADLEGLHRLVLRCADVPPPDVRRYRDEYRAAAEGMAFRSA